jgi:peptide/nickel transport system permease protein
MLFGIGLGIVASLRPRSPLDRGVVGISVVGVSAPAFASGVLLLYVLAVHWKLFPALGAGAGFTDRLYHLTLPAVAMALSATALVVKITRTAMIESLRQDYIASARARGVASAEVLVAYALRNALVPVVTSAALILAYLFTGSVLVETAFSLPGLGGLLIDAVQRKDIPVVQGVAMTLAIAVIAINLITDLVYLVIDPRIRFGRAVQ